MPAERPGQGDTQLFLHLANDSIRWRLVRFDVASGQVPHVGIPRTIDGTVTEQNGVITQEHRGDDPVSAGTATRWHLPSLTHEASQGEGPQGRRSSRRSSLSIVHPTTRLLLAIVSLGLLALVSPSALIALSRSMASGNPKSNAMSFLGGWNVSLIAVFTLAYGAGNSTLSTVHTDGHAAACIVEVVLGPVFVGLAARAWCRRDHQEKVWQATKKLSADLASLRPWQAAVFGVVEQPWTLTAWPPWSSSLTGPDYGRWSWPSCSSAPSRLPL